MVALYGCNEGCTAGIGNAVAESGRTDLIAVGFDDSDTIKQQIKKGYLLASMVQNPAVMGVETVKGAVKAYKGEKISPTQIDTGVQVQTKDHIIQ